MFSLSPSNQHAPALHASSKNSQFDYDDYGGSMTAYFGSCALLLCVFNLIVSETSGIVIARPAYVVRFIPAYVRRHRIGHKRNRTCLSKQTRNCLVGHTLSGRGLPPDREWRTLNESWLDSKWIECLASHSTVYLYRSNGRTSLPRCIFHL